MKDCGLPRGHESQCYLNRGGMCTLDTADYCDIERAVNMHECGLIGINNRYLNWKYGVTYKDLECRNCDYFSGGQFGYGECTNPEVESHPKGITENGEKKYIDSKEYYSGAKACKKFVKKKECLDGLVESVGCEEGIKRFEVKQVKKEGMEVMKDGNSCPYGKLNSDDCRCINNLDGDAVCDAIRRKDWDRYHYVREMQGNVDCDIFDKIAAEIIEEKRPEKLKNVTKTDKNDTFLPENITKASEIVTFDYSTVDEDTAAFLQDKAARITEIRFKSVVAIGKELKEAHDRLANNKTGTFELWVKSLGISHQTSRNYINGYDYILKNFEHIEDAESIQPSLLFSVSKPSARPELQQAVLSGDIKTHKEYKELEKKLKNAEFHCDTIRKSYEHLEKVNSEHYRIRVRAEEAEKKLKIELENAKRNSDPEKISQLEKSLSEKQAEIEELYQQLMDKPIEATASHVVEKLSEEVSYHLKNYAKVNQILNLLVGLSTEEMESWAIMMNDREVVGDEEEAESLELLGVAIASLQDMMEDYRQGGEDVT